MYTICLKISFYMCKLFVTLQIDRRVIRILGFRPRLDHAGSDVHLTITSTCLKLTSLDTGAIIAVHDMPNISFASGGDTVSPPQTTYFDHETIFPCVQCTHSQCAHVKLCLLCHNLVT